MGGYAAIPIWPYGPVPRNLEAANIACLARLPRTSSMETEEPQRVRLVMLVNTNLPVLHYPTATASML